MHFGRIQFCQKVRQFGEADVWMVADSFCLLGYHIQIGGRVGVYHSLGQAIAEYLMQPLANFTSGVEGAACFHLAYQLHQLGAGDLLHRTRTDTGDHIVLQVQLGLVGGAFCPAR
ncbi:hypothetical protein D9M71_497770 [compost metagenome]